MTSMTCNTSWVHSLTYTLCYIGRKWNQIVHHSDRLCWGDLWAWSSQPLLYADIFYTDESLFNISLLGRSLYSLCNEQLILFLCIQSCHFQLLLLIVRSVFHVEIPNAKPSQMLVSMSTLIGSLRQFLDYLRFHSRRLPCPSSPNSVCLGNQLSSNRTKSPVHVSHHFRNMDTRFEILAQRYRLFFIFMIFSASDKHFMEAFQTQYMPATGCQGFSNIQERWKNTCLVDLVVALIFVCDNNLLSSLPYAS